MLIKRKKGKVQRVVIPDESAVSICKLGSGKETCAFLLLDANGFHCARESSMTTDKIIVELEAGTMIAQGRGNWEGCFWVKGKL